MTLQDAENEVGNARQAARTARDELTRARELVAKRLAEWNRSEPQMTPEQNIRQWLASNQAERERRAAAGEYYPPPNITRTARAMAGGNQRRGGGSAYRRGPGGTRAFSVSQAATLNAEIARIKAEAGQQ